MTAVREAGSPTDIPRAPIDPQKAASEGGPGKAAVVLLACPAPIGDNNDFAGERTAVFALEPCCWTTVARCCSAPTSV